MTADQLIEQAKASRREGRLLEAAAYYRQAAQFFQDQPLRYAHAIRHEADILRELGHTEAAESSYNEALSLYRRHPETHPVDLANTLRGCALLASNRLQTPLAVELWQEARDLYQGAGIPAGVEEAARQLSRLQ